MNNNIKLCTRCELHKNNPEFTCPAVGIGTGELFIIDWQPTKTTILTSYYNTNIDFLRRVITKPFYYTYAIKCLGKPLKLHFNICKDWIDQELQLIKPKLVITLGKAHKLVSNKISNELLEYRGYQVVTLCSPHTATKNQHHYREFISKIQKYVT